MRISNVWKAEMFFNKMWMEECHLQPLFGFTKNIWIALLYTWMWMPPCDGASDVYGSGGWELLRVLGMEGG